MKSPRMKISSMGKKKGSGFSENSEFSHHCEDVPFWSPFIAVGSNAFYVANTSVLVMLKLSALITKESSTRDAQRPHVQEF